MSRQKSPLKNKYFTRTPEACKNILTRNRAEIIKATPKNIQFLLFTEKEQQQWKKDSIFSRSFFYEKKGLKVASISVSPFPVKGSTRKEFFYEKQ